MTSKSVEKLRGVDKLQSINKLDSEIRKQIKGNAAKKKHAVLPKLESQGTIDWSHHGIQSKYRGAKEREDAWHTWMQSVNLSKTLLEDDHKILPVVKVERHPIVAQYYKLLEEENSTSNTRTRSRLLMKRFVFDVQEIWLTNMQHLREHQPGNIHSGEELSEDYQRGEGISDRRDVRAIVGLEHQIQSVSQKRAFANAYHTSRLPPIQVVLDYKPIPPPILSEPRPLSPQLQSLLRDLKFTVNSSRNGFDFPPLQSLSQGRSYILSVDRLIPSIDLVQSNTLPDVLWRFCLIDSSSLQVRLAITSESQVATFVSQLITSQLHSQAMLPSPTATETSQVSSLRYRSEQFVPLPFADGSVEWEGQIEVTLSRSLSNPHIAGLSPLTITLTASLRPYIPPLEQTPQRLARSDSSPSLTVSLQCSPLEVRAVLVGYESSALPLANASPLSWDFWSAEDRLRDCWIPLSMHGLQLEAAMTGSAGLGEVRRLPEGLVLVSPSDRLRGGETGQALRFWERVEGALSDLQALSCVNELLKTLALVSTEMDAVPVMEFLQPRLSLSWANQLCHERWKQPMEPAQPDESDPSPAERREVIRRLTWEGEWEEILRQSPLTLSMEAERLYDRVRMVPGAMEIGKRGLWIPDKCDPTRENTQAAATFFRDETRSTTDTVLVNVIYALDTAVLTAVHLAWEAVSQKPPPYPGEVVQGVIPSVAVKKTLRVLEEHLVSHISQRPSTTVFIFTASAVEGLDYIDREKSSLLIHGCRRYLPTKNEHGFREQIEVRLLNVDSHVSTQIFGITRFGAIPNDPSVCARNIWHNTVAITEHINRPRAPKDYHYVIANLSHCGSNQPTTYTTRMRAMEMVGLTSSAFKVFEEAYQKILELRDVFGKQLALDARIERLENEVKIKENARKRQIQNELQLALEKRLKKITKSEAGWRKRLAGSDLLEVQGNWERRKDTRSGMVFFHQITPAVPGVPEKCCETCQWEVPAMWDGSALWTAKDPAIQQLSSIVPSLRSAGASIFSTETLAAEMHRKTFDGQDAAFLEPASSWAPYHPPTNADSHRTNQLMGQNSLALLAMRPVDLTDNYRAATFDATTAALRGGSAPLPLARPGQEASHTERDGHSVVSDDLNSVAADRSLDESRAATIDTANLEHIAEQLLSSDELMRVLARRLGLPESQIVPADDLSAFSVHSTGNVAKEGGGRPQGGRSLGHTGPRDTINGVHGLDERLEAPRDKNTVDLYEPEFDSDDDLWSDDEHEVGDFDAGKEIGTDDMLPQDLQEATQLRRREEMGGTMGQGQGPTRPGESRVGGRTQSKERTTSFSSAPSAVPFLDFDRVHDKSHRNEELAAERYGWRRLPRPQFREGFLAAALRTHAQGPSIHSCNTMNSPVFLLPISPVDACKYVPEELLAPLDTIFIPHAKRDVERSIATMQRNIKREQDLARALPTEDQLLTGEAKEFTSVEEFLNKQHKQQKAALDPKDAAQDRAILAAKSSNLAEMEDALAEDIGINTADEFGNTLFILAAQQGSKRMCKFLLRRGANINMQNHVGNTALHYCYAYSHHKLGEYLKAKGANDAILNVDGLTCYEGLNRGDMNQQYDDYEEGDFLAQVENGNGPGGEMVLAGDSLSSFAADSSVDLNNSYSSAYDNYAASHH